MVWRGLVGSHFFEVRWICKSSGVKKGAFSFKGAKLHRKGLNSIERGSTPYRKGLLRTEEGYFIQKGALSHNRGATSYKGAKL